MKDSIKNILFYVTVVLLIFNHMPKVIQIPWIAGPLCTKLIFFSIVIGMLYTCYCQYKSKNVFYDLNEFKIYISTHILILTISLSLGLWKYNYYDMILNGPFNQVVGIDIVLKVLGSIGLEMTQKSLLTIFMFLKPIKGLCLDIIYTFGFSYMIYCWYKDDYDKALEILYKGVFASVVMTFLYSGIEVLFLSGNESAKNILEKITPFIHAVETDVDWWPPLLWYGQLRSIFPEPSHLGNYAAMVIPFLWCSLLNPRKYNINIIISTFLFTCMIFLTKARTPNAMFLGMLFLMLIFVVLNFKEYYKKYLLICCISGVAFFVSLFFINNCMIEAHYEIKKETQMEQFINDNVLSLASNTQRSNGARYALLRSNMRVGIDNLILGVGNGLSSAYIIDYFTDDEKKNPEVSMWLAYIENHGILKYGLGAMNEYVDRFAQTGILGLGSFLLPFIYAIYGLFKLYLILKGEEKINVLFLLLSLISSLVAAMNGSITIIYNVWLLLPLSYVAIGNKVKMKKLNNE